METRIFVGVVCLLLVLVGCPGGDDDDDVTGDDDDVTGDDDDDDDDTTSDDDDSGSAADVTLQAESSGDQAGWCLDIIRDSNGDGLDDLLIGAHGRGGGSAYLVHGMGY